MDETAKVLVVEDDIDQANLLERCLENSSFEVETIHSGHSCVSRLANCQYEAVILDYHLPDITGLDVLSELSRQGCKVPVVVVSGNGNEQIAVEALKGGAYDYLVKDSTYLSMLPKVVQQSIEKSRLQQRLSESEKKYQNIFENASDAVVLLEPDSFKIIEANRKAVELFACNDLIGLNLCQLFIEDEQKKVQKVIENAYAGASFSSDNILTIANGNSSIPIELNVTVIEGDRNILLCNIRNIAEKQHLQSLILNSKRRLQGIFDGITDIIFQVNQDFEILAANKAFAQFANFEPEKVVGRRYCEVFCSRNEPCEDCPVSRTMKSLKPASTEKTHKGLIYELWSYPLVDAEGKLDSVAVYSKNITEKVKLEKTLIQSEKLATIGLLASGIAHELRNPLNVIETARYYIDEFLYSKDADISAKLDIIHKNVRRCSKIINNLLEFTRHSPHAREEIDLRSLIGNTICLIKKELDAKGIDFLFEAEQDLKAYFSVDSLKQALLNLIINGVQAMQPDGRLTVAIEQTEPGWVDIKVSDTGSGISPENLPYIFSPFFTTKDVGEGTGLGLYITHMIIEKDGGRICVDSQLGRGTTFTISLPQT